MISKRIIECIDICHNFYDRVILEDITFSIFSNTITTIIGPNGGGKSSLGKILVQTLRPTSGVLKYHDKFSVGYMPQKFHLSNLLPLSAYDFLKLSLHQKISSEDINFVMHDMHIAKISKSPISELSEGELQRLLFAKIILQNPDVLVLDEPTQGLDAQGQSYFYQKIEVLHQKYHKTIIIISHDLHIVMSSSNRVICLDKTIRCSGMPYKVKTDNHFNQKLGDFDKNLVSYYQHSHNNSKNNV